jgi:hypothetical protein
VIGKFKQEPAGDPRFSAPPVDGGMGQTAVKWVGIGVTGFKQGTATVEMYYTDAETQGITLNSLFLAFTNAKLWRKLDALGVFTGAQNVQGDIQVDVLNLNPIIAMGSDSTVAATPASAAPPSKFPVVEAAAGGAGLLIVAVAVALLAGRGRRPRSKAVAKAVARNSPTEVKRR